MLWQSAAGGHAWFRQPAQKAHQVSPMKMSGDDLCRPYGLCRAHACALLRKALNSNAMPCTGEADSSGKPAAATTTGALLMSGHLGCAACIHASLRAPITAGHPPSWREALREAVTQQMQGFSLHRNAVHIVNRSSAALLHRCAVCGSTAPEVACRALATFCQKRGTPQIHQVQHGHWGFVRPHIHTRLLVVLFTLWKASHTIVVRCRICCMAS